MANWGFLGAGSIAGSSLAPAVHACRGATLHSVASAGPERARALRPLRTHTSYQELLDDEDVEIVYVALHNSAHRRWAERALLAGKHVLCEKPLGLSAAEVDAMIDTSARTGRLLVEAAWNRWHPRTRAMEDLLAAGSVGTVTEVTARFDGLAPAPGNYRHDPALGGGALYDVGYYAVSATLAAFGWRTPRVTRAVQEYWYPGSADRAAAFRLEFPGRGSAEIRCSLVGDVAEEFTVTGTAGVLGLSAPAFCAGAAPSRLTGGDGVTRVFPAVDPYRLMVQAVEDAVAGRPHHLVPLEQTRAVAATLDAVRSACGPAPVGVGAANGPLG
ncbi:Gfo/Idh/MocA family protein [Kitasatospora sp. NBC_00315]|uniref:Gfo/Idh/MocA family protein n=1 Tax=Kitasatospora sp. NBC_00315 TaxID=2975963 RepID=UPI003255C92F